MYIVTGFCRSGTSAMMQALGQAGLVLNYRPNIIEPVWTPTGGYGTPEGDPWANAEGRVTKMVFQYLIQIHPGKPNSVFKAIAMRRPWLKRRASEYKEMDPAIWPDEYWTFDDALAEAQSMYPQAQFNVIDYDELCDAPGTVYDKLVGWGWPISGKTEYNSAIKPQYRRF